MMLAHLAQAGGWLARGPLLNSSDRRRPLRLLPSTGAEDAPPEVNVPTMKITAMPASSLQKQNLGSAMALSKSCVSGPQRLNQHSRLTNSTAPTNERV